MVNVQRVLRRWSSAAALAAAVTPQEGTVTKRAPLVGVVESLSFLTIYDRLGRLLRSYGVDEKLILGEASRFGSSWEKCQEDFD